jgi:hypothetical protein
MDHEQRHPISLTDDAKRDTAAWYIYEAVRTRHLAVAGDPSQKRDGIQGARGAVE